MNKTLSYLTLIFCALLSFSSIAQSLSSKILDSVTKNPIPYATVLIKKKGVITNEEGQFTFLMDESIQATDSLHISSIGYESLDKPISEFTEKVIYLSPKAIELREVIVSNKNYTAEEIVEMAQENLEKNYRKELAKKRLFLRQSDDNRILKTDYTIKESTIDALNKSFLDSVISTVPKSDSYYSEMLGDFYGNQEERQQKLSIIKASKLFDKSRELDYDLLEERFNDIIKKNVKTDSYFKVKSGLIGTKVEAEDIYYEDEATIDTTDVAAVNKQLEEAKKKKEKQKENYAKWKRSSLTDLYNTLPIFEDTDYNILWKPNRYHLTLEDFTYIGDKALYVISFTPKRSEDYEGKLYIDADDFALVKMDFKNVKSLKTFKLLGISYNVYLKEGSILFNKANDGLYDLKYLNVLSAERFGFRRPVQIIEKNKNVKGRRKQNELHLKIDAAFGARNRSEIVVFDVEPINKETFTTFTENNEVLPTYMANYDPEFWKGYTIMEPNTAIRQFTSEVSSAE